MSLIRKCLPTLPLSSGGFNHAAARRVVRASDDGRGRILPCHHLATNSYVYILLCVLVIIVYSLPVAARRVVRASNDSRGRILPKLPPCCRAAQSLSLSILLPGE